MNKLLAFITDWQHTRKAIGGFLGVLIPEAGALVAFGVLHGPAADTVGRVLLAGGPLWAYFGVAISKANAAKRA